LRYLLIIKQVWALFGHNFCLSTDNNQVDSVATQDGDKH